MVYSAVVLTLRIAKRPLTSHPSWQEERPLATHNLVRTQKSTAVLSEAWAKLRDWASVAVRGRLLLSGSVAHASLKTAVQRGRSAFWHLAHCDRAEK